MQTFDMFAFRTKTVVILAVALEQMHFWKAPTADRLRQLLPSTPNKQGFAALQQLLADTDLKGAVTLRTLGRVASTRFAVEQCFIMQLKPETIHSERIRRCIVFA